MRASSVLQKCLFDSLSLMHKDRTRVLLLAVEALVAGRRLTLIDVARHWPGAERIRAPLKAFDRLLGNRHLYAERERVYAIGVAFQQAIRARALAIARGDHQPRPNEPKM